MNTYLAYGSDANGNENPSIQYSITGVADHCPKLRVVPADGQSNSGINIPTSLDDMSADINLTDPIAVTVPGSIPLVKGETHTRLYDLYSGDDSLGKQLQLILKLIESCEESLNPSDIPVTELSAPYRFIYPTEVSRLVAEYSFDTNAGDPWTHGY